MTQRGVSVDVEVFHTREKGWGLRTTQAIPAGTYCMSYVGEVSGIRRTHTFKFACVPTFSS